MTQKSTCATEIQRGYNKSPIGTSGTPKKAKTLLSDPAKAILKRLKRGPVALHLIIEITTSATDYRRLLDAIREAGWILDRRVIGVTQYTWLVGKRKTVRTSRAKQPLFEEF
jgi:hypothetical protein